MESGFKNRSWGSACRREMDLKNEKAHAGYVD
jgi:hypothetical protein